MQTVMGVAAIVLAVMGFRAAGGLGVLTGLVAGFGVGSGLAIFAAAKDTGLAREASVRRGQQLGGAVAAVGCLLGVLYGGWRWGWVVGIGGYVLGALAAVGLARRADHALTLAQDRAGPSSAAGVPLLSPAEFAARIAMGRPNRMTMTPYEGAPFACGCGAEHRFASSSVPVLRELGGMQLVFQCPQQPDVRTCVHVKGALRFQGFETLFATREAR